MVRTLYLLVVFQLLFEIVALELATNVPVFIVDNERSLSSIIPSKSPFSTLNREEFSEIVRDALRKSDRVIIFVEDVLSAEDISARDQFGSPYYLLRQGLIEGSIKHFPSVDDPFSVLQDHVPRSEFNTFHLDSKTSKLSLYDSNLRNIYVFFNDGANMSRVDSLRQHDLIMREVHYVVKQRADGPVVAFYTGRVNPKAAEGDKEEISPFPWKTRRDAVWCRNNQTILAVEGIRIMNNHQVMTLPPTGLGQVECTYRWNREDNPNEVTVEMPLTIYTLQCQFTYSNVSWTLEICHLRPHTGRVGQRDGEGTHLNFGRTLRYGDPFQHNEPFDFRDDGDGVVVQKIIVEVLSQPSQKKFSKLTQDTQGSNQEESNPQKDDKGKKDETQNEGYFSIDLLGCLFVSSILISILIYGFVSLAGVHTNSRYDDPKSKPLMFAES